MARKRNEPFNDYIFCIQTKISFKIFIKFLLNAAFPVVIYISSNFQLNIIGYIHTI